MTFLPVVTVQQAAEMLGVTDSRVRQMAAQNLVRPVYRTRGGRGLVFWRTEISAYLRRESTSQIARSLPPLDQPLRLTVDTVVTGLADEPGDMIEDKPIHVRIYSDGSSGVGSARIVVLLSEPVGKGVRVLVNRIDQIVPAVADRFLDGRIADVVWVDVWPPEHWSTYTSWTTGVQVRNVLMRRTGGPGATWSASWTPMSIDELDTVVGGAIVDFFEWGSYSPALVHEWQRTDRPVDVVVDPEGIAPIVEACRKLPSEATTRVQVARRALLFQVVLLHDAAVRRRDYEARASDEFQRLEWNEDQAKIMTSRRVDYAIPSDVLGVLPNTDPDETWLATAEADMEVLTDWLWDVDVYADHPDPGQAAVVELALRCQRTIVTMSHARQSHPSRVEPVPQFFPVTVRLQDIGWDQQYREDVRWQESDPRDDASLSRAERRAARELATHHGSDRELRFGRDARGIQVVMTADAADDTTPALCTIAWPTAYDASPLPSDVQIVAVGGGGNLPVYLARRGQIIGLLPRSRKHEGWSFGYDGGGPGLLTTDIDRFLAAAGIGVDQVIRERITRGVEDSAKDELRLDVDRLISPYRA